MSTSSEAINGIGKTAVVVEDERFTRLLITGALEECGYTVLEAADGPSGLNIIQSVRHLDLLICDHGLPGGITGFEVAQRARQRCPALTVLLISGLPFGTVTGDQPLAERVGLLAKPFTMVRLVMTVCEIMSSASRPTTNSNGAYD